MLKDNINSIYLDMDKYSTYSHSELFTFFVQDKLQGTLLKYQMDIDKIEDYLLRREASAVLKRITQIQRDSDKQELNKIINEKGRI